jgi:hypothetical protein
MRIYTSSGERLLHLVRILFSLFNNSSTSYLFLLVNGKDSSESNFIWSLLHSRTSGWTRSVDEKVSLVYIASIFLCWTWSYCEHAGSERGVMVECGGGVEDRGDRSRNKEN